MSVAHLFYILQEINAVTQFLKISNISFYKRAVTRLIAVRTDDFIRIGFKVNNNTLNSQVIRDDLKGLQELYNEYFKLQRDKYGAHFQELDFSMRLEAWSDINLERASFFSEMPQTIYSQFQSIDGYVAFNNVVIDDRDIKAINKINDELNIERYVNFSSDILSLTRPNSGGVLNFSDVSMKAASLKSLELIIDYELAILMAVKYTPVLKGVLKKLFIIDLLSYVDNFYTRTDVPVDANQYEEGLEYYLRDTNLFSEAHGMAIAFKNNVKLKEITNELRVVRNKCCGHIDTQLSLVDLSIQIANVEIEPLADFYDRLKKTFRSMCYSSILLTRYLIGPNDRVSDMVSFSGTMAKSFDGEPFPEIKYEMKSLDDIDEYDRQYVLLLNNQNDESRRYFGNCFTGSKIIEQLQLENIINGEAVLDNYTYRIAHEYFEKKLSDSSILASEKMIIVNLFVSCYSGYDILGHILIRNWPVSDGHLQRHYMVALGKLLSKRSNDVLRLANSLFNIKNFTDKSVTLLTVFRIDITARRNPHGKHFDEISIYSEYIKSTIIAENNQIERLAYVLILNAEYVFGNHHLSDSLDGLYKDFFYGIFCSCLRDILSQYLTTTQDNDTVDSIIQNFEEKRFITSIAILCDFLFSKNLSELENWFLLLLKNGFVQFSRLDDQELHNYSGINFKAGNIEIAIDIAKHLVNKHAYKVDHYYLLLDIYRRDVRYENNFRVLKSKILKDFNLTQEETEAFAGLEMETQKQ